MTLGTPNVSQASQIQMHSGAEPSVLFVGVLHWRGSIFGCFTYKFLLPLSPPPPSSPLPFSLYLLPSFLSPSLPPSLSSSQRAPSPRSLRREPCQAGRHDVWQHQVTDGRGQQSKVGTQGQLPAAAHTASTSILYIGSSPAL